MPTTTRSVARQQFRRLIHLSDTEIPLAIAALTIAWEDQNHDQTNPTLHQIEMLAEGARTRLYGYQTPRERILTLNHYLFHEQGFHGNVHHYDDPMNIFLDRVIETRTGLPITLSVLYIEIGRRLGLPIVGVALPGHFLVRYLSFGEMLCIDPFYRGRLWTQADCMRRIRATIPRATPEQIADLLQPTTNAAIVQRLLRNLKHSYLARSDFVRAIAAVERLLLFAPNDPEEIRDRGLLRSRLNYAHYAVEDFERYAALAPTARDLPEIQRYAQLLTARLARGN